MTQGKLDNLQLSNAPPSSLHSVVGVLPTTKNVTVAVLLLLLYHTLPTISQTVTVINTYTV